MKVESEVDVDRADQLVRELEGLVTMAEPALEENELESLNDAMGFIEDVAGIETGKQFMESEMTDRTYLVTRWVEMGDGQIMALSKREVEDR